MENRKAEFTIMRSEKTLSKHLKEIQEKATEMITEITKKLAIQMGITEELKIQDEMKWVGMMNNCKAMAEEQVVRELIYN